jgi:hypothetical protein
MGAHPMTGSRFPIVRKGQVVTLPVEEITPAELAAAFHHGGPLEGQGPHVAVQLLSGIRELHQRLPYLLQRMTPSEVESFGFEQSEAWESHGMLSSTVHFAGGPFDGLRRGFDRDHRLKIIWQDLGSIYERAYTLGHHAVWKWLTNLRKDEW